MSLPAVRSAGATMARIVLAFLVVSLSWVGSGLLAPASALTIPSGYQSFATYCASSPRAFTTAGATSADVTSVKAITFTRTGGSLVTMGDAGTTSNGWRYNSTAMGAGNVMYAIAQNQFGGAGKLTNLILVSPNGQVTDLGPITSTGPNWTQTAFNQPNAGVIVGTTYYFAYSALGKLYALDLTQPGPNFTAAEIGGTGVFGPDITYVDGYLWSLNGTTIYRTNPTTGATSTFTLPFTVDGGGYGSAWTLGNGNLGFANNTTGAIYQIDVNAASSDKPSFVLISKSPGQPSSANDGTNCIPGSSDLTITKTADPITATAGDRVTYTLTVRNNGPDASSGYTVSDTMPAGLTNVTISSNDSYCTENAGKYSCVGGILANGASHVITIAATLPADFTKITNTAQVLNHDNETSTGSNSAGTTTYAKSTAEPDTVTVAHDTTATIDVLANDKAGAGATLTSGSVCILTSGGCLTTVTTAQGVWTVLPSGSLTFDPKPGFAGDASVTYQVTDSNGQKVSATATVTVQPAAPTLAPDAVTTGYEKPITFNPLANDSSGSSSVGFDPGSVQLQGPNGTWVTSLTTAAGTYTVDSATGQITFTPVDGFFGAAPEVAYRVTNTQGTTKTSTIATTVGNPPPPYAQNDTSTGLQGAVQTLSPLTNDVSGDANVSLQPTSLQLWDGSAWVKSMTVSGVGTYDVNADGTVTFTPDKAFSGPAPAVDYRVADAAGQFDSATITATVTAVTPTAANDSVRAPYGTTVTKNLLANDAAGDSSVPLVPTSVRFKDPATDNWVTSVQTSAGTYTLNDAGVVTFVPKAGFFGLAPDLTYRVADANGTYAEAVLSSSVGSPPTALADQATVRQGGTVEIAPLTNDTVGARTTMDESSVLLWDPASQTWKTTVTIAGEGTYTVGVGGKVSFAAMPSFTGPSTVKYSFADADGIRAENTITVTVTPVSPTALIDSPAVDFNTALTFDALANDKPGDPAVPLVPSSIRFQGPNDTWVTEITNAHGTYTINTDTNQVTFTPTTGFRGQATPVPYRVLDANGTAALAVIAPVVDAPAPPELAPDTGSGLQGQNVTVDVLANDTKSADGGNLKPETLKLIDPVSGELVESYTIDGVGTVTINAGQIVVVDPEPTFVGQIPTIKYQVEDENGAINRTTVTVTYTPVTVTAEDYTLTTAYNEPITVLAANDARTSAPNDVTIVPTSVTLIDPSTGQPSTSGSVEIPGRGTFSVGAAGSISFTPVPGFVGSAGPITYSVKDTNGTVDTATVKVTVNLPPAPEAAPDTATTKQGEPVTIDLLGNDSAATGVTLVNSSLRLIDADGNPVTKLTVPGEGTYTVINGSGTVVFEPLPGFTGSAKSVNYVVTDSTGQTASSTVTVSVTVVTPTATDVEKTTPWNQPVTTDVMAGVTAGDPTAPMQPSSVRLVAADGSLVATLVVPGEGTYTANGDGTIKFVPEPAFTGTSTVTFSVADENGTRVTSDLAITVGQRPQAQADSATTPQNVPTAIKPLDNDTTDPTTTMDPKTLKLVDPATGDSVTMVTIADEGTYTANADGTVNFDPVPAFTGTSTVTYFAETKDGNPVTSTITVTVTPVTPVAANDSVWTPFGTSVTTDLLANDAPGLESIALDPTTVRLKDPATGDWVLSVTTSAGTYSVDKDTGAVSFAPAAGFYGTAPDLTYRVADANGTFTTAILSSAVGMPPTAVNDQVTVRQGGTVEFFPLANDTVDPTATINTGSLQLWDPVTESWQKSITIPGEGTYTVAADGKVTFVGDPGFTATYTVRYSFADSNGARAEGEIAIKVTPVQPSAVNDSPAIGFNSPGTKIDVLANDSEGHPEVPLVPTALELQAPDGSWGSSATMPGEGTYTINPDHTVTFTPVDGFRGEATPVPYRIYDTNGTLDVGTISPLVDAPPAPLAMPDTASGVQGQTLAVSVLVNDGPSAAGGFPVPGSLQVLDPTSGLPVDSYTIPGVGTVKVGTGAETGKIIVDPAPGFFGTFPVIQYQITDTYGASAQSTLTVSYDQVTVTAKDYDVTTPFNTPVRVPAAADATTSAPEKVAIDPTSTKLIDPASGKPTTVVVVPGQGSFEVGVLGDIVFTPAPGFTGTAGPITYTVADRNGTIDTATFQVKVALPPAAVANPDTPSTVQGVPIKIDVLANDTAGHPGAPLLPSSVRLLDPVTGNPAMQVTIPGEGTYTVNTNGTISFVPAPDFVGTSTVNYQASTGYGNNVSSSVTVTVLPGPTTAPDGTGDDQAQGAQGQPITIDVLANDKPGSPDRPLDPSTLCVVAPSGECKKSVAIAGEGTWSANPDGTLTFTPLPTFVGTTTPVTYQVKDISGAGAAGTAVVVVNARGPKLTPDKVTGPCTRASAVVDPLANDRAKTGTAWDRGSLRLLAPTRARSGGSQQAWAPVKRLSTPGVGTWEVVGSRVRFVPVAGWSGTATVRYQIADREGALSRSTITVKRPARCASQAPSGGFLPSTGGPALAGLWLGLAMLLGGVGALGWRRRRS